MSDFRLAANSPLNKAELKFDGISVVEVTDGAIVSIATPHESTDRLSEIVLDHYKTNLPDVGRYTQSSVNNAKFLGMAPKQFFLFFDCASSNALDLVRERLETASYLTDQSDSWVILKIEGKKTCEVLERICTLDLEISAFPEGSVARTVMEHLGVIIIRQGLENYLLFSARSSAKSFFSMIEKTIQIII